MKRSIIGLGLAICSTGAASAALLGIAPGQPSITYVSSSSTATRYDAATRLFTVTATPSAIQFAPTESPLTIFSPRALSLRVEVDHGGALVGGVSGADLVVSGLVGRIVGTVTNIYSGVLLEGEVTEFGYEDSGTTVDRYELRFTPTGGALLEFFTCGNLGVTVTSEGSTFTGSFAVNFNGRARGNVALEDRTPPNLLCPEDQVVECNTQSGGLHGAFVEYPVLAATGNCAANESVVCDPPSGSFFALPVGVMSTNYSVVCTATDAAGNQSTCAFQVTVQDTVAPEFDDNSSPLIAACALEQALQRMADPGQCFATVTFPRPTATDCCDDNVNVDVSAVDENGVTLPLVVNLDGTLTGQFPVSLTGSNVITVVADDGHGNTTQHQCPVIVIDNQPPSITCTGDQTVTANCDGNAEYVLPVAFDNCAVQLQCVPGLVGLGETTVQCTATDPSGNTTTCSFVVTALPTVQDIVWHAPLAGNTDHSTTPPPHKFKAGQTVVVQVHVEGCEDEDVTSQVDGVVSVVYVDQTPVGPVYHEIAEDYSGIGGAGGLMDHINGHLKYNLKTDKLQYPGGTVANDDRFELTVTIKRDGTPLYQETIYLESK